MRNEMKITKKLAGLFINIGEAHTNSISFGTGYYEPKISKNLLKKNLNKEK